MLDPKVLLAEAQSRTGLHDFGEDSFREPFELLLRSVNEETRFSEFGAVAFREMIVHALTNRLKMEDWYTRHPEIDDEEIVEPVFIVGMPRTGSTLLSSLFALDPETRALRTWESPTPAPPPIKGDLNDPRIAEGEAHIRLFKERWPAMFQMIPMGVHEPCECFELMYNAFCCDYFYQYTMCSKYLDWIYTPGRDLAFGYRYHKRALKILQWHCPPKRWLLKMPGHCFMIESLNKVYPDAKFIMTHRDPVKCVPSVSRLVSLMREDFMQDVRTDEFFWPQVEIWDRSIHRLLDFRSRHEARFTDIEHRALLADSAAEVERLYRDLGWRFSPELAAAISQWRDANPRDDRAPGGTSTAFDRAEVARRFAFYYERFK